MEREELGAWLRHQRETRCWSRPKMARQLIRVAHAANDRSMTDVDNLSHNIYRWERGAVSPGERYRLYYCRALSIPPAAFGGDDSAGTGTLVLPQAWHQAYGHASVASSSFSSAFMFAFAPGAVWAYMCT
jgi:hypothetical protein